MDSNKPIIHYDGSYLYRELDNAPIKYGDTFIVKDRNPYLPESIYYTSVKNNDKIDINHINDVGIKLVKISNIRYPYHISFPNCIVYNKDNPTFIDNYSLNDMFEQLEKVWDRSYHYKLLVTPLN